MRHRRFSKTMRGLALVIFLTGFTLTGIVPWPAWDTAHAAVTAYSVRGAFLTDLGGAHTGEVTFDDLAPWTDVEGQTVDGIYFKTPWLGCDPYGGSTYRCGTQTSAPLTVITGITGMPATTGANLLSPGGTDIAACSDPSLDNDDLVLHFMEPVSAVGLDVILQIDGGSNLGVRVLGSSGNILYDEPDVQIVMPITPYTGVRFIGFISDTEDIARVEIDEYDEECTGYDAHVGYDSIVYADPLNEEGFTFSPNIILPGTGSTPNSVAIGDVDRDGIGDMAVALPGINRVALYAGIGDHPGTMPVPVLLDTGAGSAPAAVAIADVTGDGIGDIAAANPGNDTVSIFVGQEMPPSPDPVPITTSTGVGSAPAAVAIGDSDGDGIGDLAVALPGINRVALYAGIGDTPGTMPVPVLLDTGAGSAPSGVAIGDVTGDGIGDIAVANPGNDTVSIFVGQEMPPSPDPVPITTSTGAGSAPAAVAIGDSDGDGIGDLAVALPGINRVALYAGVGDHPGGAMPVPVLLDTGAGSAPSAVTFGDLNGDGRLDLAVAAPGVNRVFLYAGVGDHPGTNPVSLYAGGIGDPGTMPVSVAIGDLNGDMRPDLATANFDSDSVTLYRNSTEFCDGADDDSDGQTDENFPSGDTSCGADVEVTRPTSFGDVAVKYPGVNYPGDTTVTTGNTGDAPPSGHSMGRTPVWYDIATTANFTGAATVCLDYDEANYSSELRLRLFHYNGSGWNNITTSLDTTANIICGNTTSFSPFIIAEELSTAVTLQNISALPDGNQVIINWSTSFEIDNEGFVILRSESPNGPFIPITQGMIPAMGGAGKATYTFTDANVESGKTYYYRLHDIDTRGKVTAHQVIPATDAVAKAGENTQGTAGKEDKASSASQQTKVASDKDIIEGKSRQPGQPAAWMSVVMEESENMPSGNTGLPPTLTIPRPVATAFGASGNPGVGNKEELAPAATAATTGVVALQNNPAITGGNALQPQGPSSFSVSIEDEKGNIIVVSKIGNTAGTDAQISGQSDRPEGLSLQVKEDSGRIVLTWEGRRGVKGFILQRSEKGKDSYAPVSSLIPYFGQDDKDVLLYRFSDMNAKPGVKYDYRLERVEADPKGGLKIGKLVD